ncbi:MAG: T9SS type A sorting domain-containing protein [Bacteroidota bacterium]
MLKEKLHIFHNHTSHFIGLIFLVSLFSFSSLSAQTYSGSVTFGNSGQYSFDYDVECGSPPNTATLTVTFTSSIPLGLVPQLHLGGGVFVGMLGSNPYSYQLTGLTNCEFSFSFYMAYINGGLYQSPQPLTPNNVPLPVILSNFEVHPYSANAALLEWQTLSEINSDYFSIERSMTGEDWEFLGQVKAGENSVIPIAYSFVDSQFPAGRDRSSYLYYRLRMVDLDGTFEFSDIRSLRIEQDQANQLHIFPNPTTDLLQVDVGSLGMNEKLFIEIYAHTGQLLLSKAFNNAETIRLDLSSFPKGHYPIIVRNETAILTRNKVLKF